MLATTRFRERDVSDIEMTNSREYLLLIIPPLSAILFLIFLVSGTFRAALNLHGGFARQPDACLLRLSVVGASGDDCVCARKTKPQKRPGAWRLSSMQPPETKKIGLGSRWLSRRLVRLKAIVERSSPSRRIGSAAAALPHCSVLILLWVRGGRGQRYQPLALGEVTYDSRARQRR